MSVSKSPSNTFAEKGIWYVFYFAHFIFHCHICFNEIHRRQASERPLFLSDCNHDSETLTPYNMLRASQNTIIQSSGDSKSHLKLFISLTSSIVWKLKNKETKTTLTTCIRVLEELTLPQLVKKIPSFYRTRRFITAFTTARHLSLSSATSIQPTSLHPVSWRSTLVLSSDLRLSLPNRFFPSAFPTKPMSLYGPLPHTCHMPCPFHSSLFDHQITHDEADSGWSSSLCILLNFC